MIECQNQIRMKEKNQSTKLNRHQLKKRLLVCQVQEVVVMSETKKAIDKLLKPYSSEEKPVVMPKWKSPSQATIMESDRIRRKFRQEREAAKHGPKISGDIDKSLGEYYAEMRRKAKEMGVTLSEFEAGQVPQAYPKIKGEDDIFNVAARAVVTGDIPRKTDGSLDYNPIKPDEKRRNKRHGRMEAFRE